ncbi:MAG: helix-turn-helix transcriptional regulator [Polaribacter sp.]|nr:helix-turn-helix transcriptional regulator [Polaribacter sp.]
MIYPSDEELMKDFGKRIKFLRKKYKLTQSELAGKAELEKTAIQRIERGYNSTLKTLRKLANAFEISLSELCDIKIDEV